jgi:phosphocarrier protein
LKREVVIINKLGLHARAAAKFVHKANEFSSHVFLDFNSQRVNGKSIMGLLMLAAPIGSRIEIETEGSDAEEAMTALAGMIADRFGEKE